jgi:hypothetical protein
MNYRHIIEFSLILTCTNYQVHDDIEGMDVVLIDNIEMNYRFSYHTQIHSISLKLISSFKDSTVSSSI